ncbi:hypothetical protein Tcan_09437 [Toxocara canis]|uniref:RRM domain-containing protein n=1 Tax=Toxocara canis TaxID=6265 RepID=A0A0B2W3H4_TOXCA|nr:hypothetical protein Tcan_09437 [Toxocara canis]
MDRMDGRWIDGREIRVALARYERPIDERSSRSSGYRSSRRRLLLCLLYAADV